MKRGQFYIPGDTWIYYKIYLMPGLSDPFLVRVMYPLLCRFYQEKKIRLWYFIRYTDPDFHLRIRIRLESTDHLTPVLKAVRKELHPWLQKGKIKNVQLDTYQREYDHYGSHTIQWFEELFFHDSVAIAMLLTNLDLDNDGEQDMRWLSAIKSADRFLNDFGLSFETRKSFLYQLYSKVSDEMPGYSDFIHRISLRFRVNRKQLERVMYSYEQNERINIFDERSRNNRDAVKHILAHKSRKRLEVPLPRLIASILHLSLNRLFATHQHLNELATYVLLFRYYKAKLGREKYDKGYKL